MFNSKNVVFLTSPTYLSSIFSIIFCIATGQCIWRLLKTILVLTIASSRFSPFFVTYQMSKNFSFKASAYWETLHKCQFYFYLIFSSHLIDLPHWFSRKTFYRSLICHLIYTQCGLLLENNFCKSCKFFRSCSCTDFAPPLL